MDYLTDPRDAVLFRATPTFMAPRFGKLEPPSDGSHRFVVGHDGLYLEARNAWMEFRMRLAGSVHSLPYGIVREGFFLRHGPIPQDLLERASNHARDVAPNEWAGLILFVEGQYHLIEPALLVCSPTGLRYDTADIDQTRIVVDLHSHGDSHAYFSKTDDSDDRNGGIVLAGVLGNCRSESPTWAWRCVANGYFFALEQIVTQAGTGFVPRN